MKIRLHRIISSIAILFSMHVFAEKLPEEQLHEDCLKINHYIAMADKLYKARKYQQAREKYEQQVALSEACQLSDDKIATAYNNVALTYIHSGEFLKANVWLNIIKSNEKSMFNLDKNKALIANAEDKAKKQITGTYWSYTGLGFWSTIKVAKKGNGNYNLEFNGFHPNQLALYGGVNTGEFYTTLAIKNNKARYVMDPGTEGDCTFDFTFDNNNLYVKRIAGELTECGFGANVTAEGSYYKVHE